MSTMWNDANGEYNPVSAPDFLPVEQLRRVQLQRMQATVQRAYDRVDLVRTRMREKGIEPGDIKSLDDVANLPFTEKIDLRDTYPFGLFASPMGEIVRLHASSGTTGKPTVVAYTEEDIQVWASTMARTFACNTLHRGDILQNAYGYGLFTGGLGAHYGAEKLGMTVIPISGGQTDRQIMLLKDFGVTAMSCTPSYFVHVIERAREIGVDLRDLPLRAGIFGAEPWSEGIRKHVEEEAGIKAFDIYGLSEIIGPGVASECIDQGGIHIFEDHFFPEIVDPVTSEVLPEGEIGELVLTTLSKRAMPMIRYRTHDLTHFVTEKCPCGRTIRRVKRIGARSDDMFIIRGVNIFPSQIESALLEVEGVQPHYQIILTRDKGLDRMEVQVEVTAEMFSDQIRKLEELQTRISKAIEHTLGISVGVRLVEPHTIERSMGKAKRLIDKRNV